MNKIKIIHKMLKLGFYFFKTDSQKNELLEFIEMLRPKDVGIRLVRLGSHGDGGYLVPDDLINIRACFSPGVGNNSDFELDLANKGIRCFLADYSVDQPAVYHDNFHFLKKFISNEKGPEFIDFESWIKLSNIESLNSDYILSMDIEGYELEVLLSAKDETLEKFRIIVLELHGIERIFHKPILLLYKLFIAKLLNNFYICHIHPSNAYQPIIRHGVDIPCILEISLINKNRVNSTNIKTVEFLPHPLDVPNVTGNPDVNLSAHWF